MTSEYEHPLYKYSLEEKQKIWRALDLTEKLLAESIDAVLDWFQKQPHLADAYICREYVERTLIVSKGSLEKTKQRIDNFYKCRAFASDMVQNRENFIKELSVSNNNWSVIPMAKMHNCNRIIYTRMAKQNKERIDFERFLKFSCLNGDIRMQCDYMLGDIWVVDWKNVSLSQIITTNPMALKKSDKLVQALGWRVVSIHMMNAMFPAGIANSFLGLLSQFFNGKLMSRILIHDSPEELHQYIPKDLLPKEYGGDAPSFDFLEEEVLNYFQSDEVLEIAAKTSRMISDEPKRPEYDKDEESLAGSFRQLQFD